MATSAVAYAGTVTTDTTPLPASSTYTWTSPANAQGAPDGTNAATIVVNGANWSENSVRLVVAGAYTGNDKSTGATLPGTSFTAVDYGSLTDMWGIASLIGSQVNSGTFGGGYSVKNGATTSQYLKAVGYGTFVDSVTGNVLTENAQILGVKLTATQYQAGTLSLAKGTLVSTPYGHKLIEDIQVGDKVYAYYRGKTVVVTVTLARTSVKETMSVKTDVWTRVTPRHQYYIGQGRYRMAKYLKPGDELYQLKNGQVLTTIVTETNPVLQMEQVYSIDVEKPHNFFANEIVVHNGVVPNPNTALVDSMGITLGYTPGAYRAQTATMMGVGP